VQIPPSPPFCLILGGCSSRLRLRWLPYSAALASVFGTLASAVGYVGFRLRLPGRIVHAARDSCSTTAGLRSSGDARLSGSVGRAEILRRSTGCPVGLGGGFCRGHVSVRGHEIASAKNTAHGYGIDKVRVRRALVVHADFCRHPGSLCPAGWEPHTGQAVDVNIAWAGAAAGADFRHRRIEFPVSVE
jgi:hypothetical protein